LVEVFLHINLKMYKVYVLFIFFKKLDVESATCKMVPMSLVPKFKKDNIFYSSYLVELKALLVKRNLMFSLTNINYDH
jgi:hypothetical protein